MADRVEIIKDQWDLFSAHLFMKRNLEMSCEVSRTFIPTSFATVFLFGLYSCACVFWSYLNMHINVNLLVQPEANIAWLLLNPLFCFCA